MNRRFAFGVLGWFALAALGACQGPDAFYRSPDGSSPGSGGRLGGSIGGARGAGGSGLGGMFGIGGARGLGGVTGAGGARGTGGLTGSGGRIGTGDATGTDGGTGIGGATAVGGRTGFDGGTGCIATLIGNDYAAAPAAPCSACKDNQLSLTDKCTGMVDCLAPLYPCSGDACFTFCLNRVGGSAPVEACVRALVTAACAP